jgi:hypothetical protein
MVTRSATALGLTSLLQQAAVKLQPYTQQAADVVWPHLQPTVQAATPYVQQVPCPCATWRGLQGVWVHIYAEL